MSWTEKEVPETFFNFDSFKPLERIAWKSLILGYLGGFRQRQDDLLDTRMAAVLILSRVEGSMQAINHAAGGVICAPGW